MLLNDTIIIPEKDTIIRLPKNTVYRIEPNPEAKSEAFYDSLKVKAYRSRVTKELYNILIISKNTEKQETGLTVKSVSIYKPYTKCFIGNIRLKSVNVLEGDVDDTTIVAKSTFGKLADKTHIYTRSKVIYNTLIFNKGDRVSPDVLADNERLIRQLGFVHDARILLVPRKHDKDTVDVVIITQDKFDYQFELLVISPSNFDIKLKDNSLLGLGKELGLNYYYNANHTPESGYSLFYHDRNFRRSFIDIFIEYNNHWSKEGTEIHLNKTFLTPQVKWGGGVSAGITSQHMGINDYKDTTYNIPFTHNFQDAWLGRSFQLGSVSQRKNLTITARVFREEYTSRPYVDADSNAYFYNDILMIGGLSFTQVSYFRTTMIKAYGVTEDMPVGFYSEINPAYVMSEFGNTPYVGLKGGWAGYLPRWGYVNTLANIGGFLQNQRLYQGAYQLKLGYISPLVDIRRWRFRQFVNLGYTAGLNREKFRFITLNDQVYGLPDVLGDQRLSLRLESVFFKPLSFYGFQLALFLFSDIALLGTGTSPAALDDYYYSIGGGIRIRNEGLVIQSMEIRIGYVPKMPEGPGKLAYSFSSNDPEQFKLLSVGKPVIVPFH